MGCAFGGLGCLAGLAFAAGCGGSEQKSIYPKGSPKYNFQAEFAGAYTSGIKYEVADSRTYKNNPSKRLYEMRSPLGVAYEYATNPDTLETTETGTFLALEEGIDPLTKQSRLVLTIEKKTNLELPCSAAGVNSQQSCIPHYPWKGRYCNDLTVSAREAECLSAGGDIQKCMDEKFIVLCETGYYYNDNTSALAYIGDRSGVLHSVNLDPNVEIKIQSRTASLGYFLVGITDINGKEYTVKVSTNLSSTHPEYGKIYLLNN